jgi:tetratricopeptide (TPR) repeat protein
MSVTVVLAAMALRLSQMTRSAEDVAFRRLLPRPRWFEIATASILTGAWSIHTFVGPAVASVYWDRYMRCSASNSQLTHQQWSDLLASGTVSDPHNRGPLNELMIGQLEQVTKWDPEYARAHLRLAALYITKFELLQQDAENAMSRVQIKDAALVSAFKTQKELDAWLHAAFGPNIDWLRRAAAEARHAVELCPLQGEGYLYLADLCFLNVGDSANADSYIEQVLRVRPYDCEVHYVVGERAWLIGDFETAFKHWQICFNDSGPHQLRIIYWLAGRMPAELFLSAFQPDWQTLPSIWGRYRSLGQPHDAKVLLAYSAKATQRETKQKPAAHAAEIWAQQASMYRDVGRREESLDCLRRAYDCAPTNYAVRLAFAGELANAGRYAEAQPHYRWCLARQPMDKSLSETLKNITKQNLAQRESRPGISRGLSSRLPTNAPAASSAPTASSAPVQPKP